MLPFMDKKRIVGSVISSRSGKNTEIAPEHEVSKSDETSALEAHAEAILHAIEHKSVSDLAQALKGAFDKLESMPHEEIEHEEAGE